MITDKFGKILDINDTVVTVENNKLRICTVLNNSFKKDYLVLQYTDGSRGSPGCCKHKNNVIKV
jgi:hypothetical protein